jgi:hypothetical protein
VQIVATITNVGMAPTQEGFWVELYINPLEQPTINQRWDTRCGMLPCYGVVWGIEEPLAPGEQVILTATPGEYREELTIWPGWFAAGTTDLYLLADSWNCDAQEANCTPTGAIAESNEANNLFHLGGLEVVGINPPNVTLHHETAPLRPPEP